MRGGLYEAVLRRPLPLRVTRCNAVCGLMLSERPSFSPRCRRKLPAKAIIAALSVQLATGGTTTSMP